MSNRQESDVRIIHPRALAELGEEACIIALGVARDLRSGVTPPERYNQLNYCGASCCIAGHIAERLDVPVEAFINRQNISESDALRGLSSSLFGYDKRAVPGAAARRHRALRLRRVRKPLDYCAMRAAVAVVLALVANSASAQDAPATSGYSTPGTSTTTAIPACTEAFADLPRIADRLDVKPMATPHGTMVLAMCDGRSYDFIALMNAFLDKMDHAH